MRLPVGSIIFLFVFSFAANSASFPEREWIFRPAGKAEPNLKELAQLVSGRGCVVRAGEMIYTWGDQTRSSDVASAFKPLLSTLLLFAIQEQRIGSVDSKVAEFEPALTNLN